MVVKPFESASSVEKHQGPNKLPVALFCFRRPVLTRQVFQRIREYKPNKLFVIMDGPRTGDAIEEELVAETKRIFDNIDWECDLTTNYAPQNLGLRDRLLSGLDLVFEAVPSAIVLEDDCLPAPDFFEFMEAGLSSYQDFPQVGMVSGTNFSPGGLKEADAYFARTPYIWGWGSWDYIWKEFRASPQVEAWTEEEFAKLSTGFKSVSQRRNFMKMMRGAAEANTWDISLAVWFRQTSKLCLVPRVNLVANLGMGIEATHTKFQAFDIEAKVGSLGFPVRLPHSIEPDDNHEAWVWRRKSARWIWFPLLHPIDVSRRLLSYKAGNSLK